MSNGERRVPPIVSVVAAEETAPSTAPAQVAASFSDVVGPFLTTYCTSCHGEEKQKGDRRFDILSAQISDDDVLVDYQDILDQLNLSEMPPQKAKQPPYTI